MERSARDRSDGRRNKPPRFFRDAALKNPLVIDYVKLPILVREESGDLRWCSPAWAGILINISSRTVKEIRATTEVPGPQLFQTLLAKAVEGVETPRHRGELLVQHVITNNGREFKSRAAANLISSLGLKISYIPPYKMPFKGTIERIFSALNQECLKTLPGYDSDKKRTGNASGNEGGAFLTLPELQAVVDKWVTAHNMGRLSGAA